MDPLLPLKSAQEEKETEFIECKASTMIPSKSTVADSGEKVSEDSSNVDAAVCEHEQSRSDDEEIELNWTKEALTFKWYEKPEDWDWLRPADDGMDDMRTRYREVYFSFLRLDKLKKKTTSKKNNRILGKCIQGIGHGFLTTSGALNLKE